jgi:hypothetical protein
VLRLREELLCVLKFCNLVVNFGGWRSNTPRAGDTSHAQTCCRQCQYYVVNSSCRLIEQVFFFKKKNLVPAAIER